MRFARRCVVVPIALGCAAAMSLARADDGPGLGSRGLNGALLGEKPGVVNVAPVATTDTLTAVTDYLAQRNAKVIEDLSVEDLERTAKVPKEDAKKRWRARLAQLAKEELGRRGVTNDPFPSPAAPDTPDPRPAMTLTAGELEVLARIVKGETWPGTPAVGEEAVASVVLNRVLAKGFPGTVSEVAKQPWQFSCYNADVRDELYWGPIRPSAVTAAKRAAAGADPVVRATHYFNPYLVLPSWASKLKFVKRIGTTAKDTHDFYR